MGRLETGRWWWLVVGIVFGAVIPEVGMAQEPVRSHIPLPLRSSAPPPAPSRPVGAVWHTPLFAGIPVTPDQQAQLDIVQRAFLQRVRAVANAPRDTANAIRRVLQHLVEASRVQMRAVLTPRQQQRFDTNLARLTVARDSVARVQEAWRDSLNRPLKPAGPGGAR